jgi:hypothetical protein
MLKLTGCGKLSIAARFVNAHYRAIEDYGDLGRRFGIDRALRGHDLRRF